MIKCWHMLIACDNVRTLMFPKQRSLLAGGMFIPEQIRNDVSKPMRKGCNIRVSPEGEINIRFSVMSRLIAKVR